MDINKLEVRLSASFVCYLQKNLETAVASNGDGITYTGTVKLALNSVPKFSQNIR
jgi:hypothetical protein